jgi:Uma2 family endonuclease
MTSAERLTTYEETPARFTAEQFMELIQAAPMAEWFGKVELVKGVITRMAPAQIPHWNAQRIVFVELHEALRDMAPDWIVGHEPSVQLSGDTVREPDVAILRNPGMTGKIFDRTALFLAIEIADSSLKIDMGVKRQGYAEAFIPHYWVVDINGRQTHVMRDPAGGAYRSQHTIRFGDPLEIPELGGTITLD